MLRRAKTTRAAGGERKPRAKQQREAEQLQSNEDLAFFGGGLAADSTAEHFTSLEPFGSTADGTQSWRGPSTRHRDTSSMLPPTLSRPRAMSADYADTPRTRLRQTTAQLHGTSAELHLTAQKVMRLERARNVSSGTDGTPGDATPGERVVESTIDPSDLSATWEDRQDGRSDWRECPVSLGQSGKWLEGQTGKVLRAVWKSSIAVAVKEGDWDEMTDEMHLFLDLTHPHVVACYGILTETREKTDHEGRVLPYPSKSIVTERCKVPLEAFLKDHNAWDQDLFGNALDAGMVDMRKYTILHHVALGLQKLHDLKVLHRDIKSGNILLDGAPGTCNSCDHSGLWKICDFGEAKVLKTPSLNFSSPQRFPKGWSHELVKDGRFCRITSPILKQKGARYCKWGPIDEHLYAFECCMFNGDLSFRTRSISSPTCVCVRVCMRTNGRLLVASWRKTDPNGRARCTTDHSTLRSDHSQGGHQSSALTLASSLAERRSLEPMFAWRVCIPVLRGRE
jgi:hypothetical protein